MEKNTWVVVSDIEWSGLLHAEYKCQGSIYPEFYILSSEMHAQLIQMFIHIIFQKYWDSLQPFSAF